MPRLSIITVTYNAERVLERTIQSIIASCCQRSHQPNEEVEYLVIDGGSTDGTLTLIRRYESNITHWISEPDKGLYDAMNKGLQLATGEYVWFMNAGDEVHNADVIPQLLSQIQTDPADVYYSDALYINEKGQPLGLRSQLTPHTLPSHLSWYDMAMGMKVCHQAFIPRRHLAPTYPIDNLSADIDWEIRCLKTAKKVVFLKFLLCKYLTGGLSTQRHHQSLIDRFKILAHHFGYMATIWNHSRIMMRAIRFRKPNPYPPAPS